MKTRRDFLSSGAALAAPTFLSAQSPNDAVRVAVIGVGNRGAYLLRHVLNVPKVQIVALCDLDAQRLTAASKAAAAKGHNPAAYTDFRKMLDERKDIDAVLIATPVDTHKMIAIAALEVGKHVYCEKPMAVQPADARMMVMAAKNAKGIFQAGFQLRHDPNRAAAMKYLHSGALGKVLYAHGMRHTGDLPRETAWYFDRVRSGDNIVEQACHILDLFVWAIGKPPLRAFGSGGINLYKGEPAGRTTMDNYSVIYEFPDNVRMNFSHIYFDPAGFSGIKERVWGEKGAVDLAAATWSALNQKGENKIPVENEGKDSTYLSLEAFVDNARAKRKPLNNAESAQLSTLVAMMGRKSIYEQRVVTWEEMNA
ncbi:MAG: Gfo/Idh/MocA family oxidoreductase [Acidobacteria bacterium]|nr:Gfo/Idh/MocA family oxidoreductase [Acidobacteriota bacterium]